MKRLAIILLLLTGCSPRETVVVYTSQDQIHAEKIFENFARSRGIGVLPVFDSESVKTAGLVQRLIAEKDHPQADVFWSNEEMLFSMLLERGVLNTNFWTHAGFRTRRLIINTNKVTLAEAPKTLAELTLPKWSGRIAMAYPLYGTTAAHMVALRQLWGDTKWRKWCAALVANKPMVVDGNSVVVRLVGAGEVSVGLTDWDDLEAGLRDGLPITSVPDPDSPVTDEFLRIRSSVGIVRNAPHARAAEEFYRFIESQFTTAKMVELQALEGAVSNYGLDLKQPAPVQETLEELKTIFARK